MTYFCGVILAITERGRLSPEHAQRMNQFTKKYFPEVYSFLDDREPCEEYEYALQEYDGFLFVGKPIPNSNYTFRQYSKPNGETVYAVISTEENHDMFLNRLTIDPNMKSLVDFCKKKDIEFDECGHYLLIWDRR